MKDTQVSKVRRAYLYEWLPRVAKERFDKFPLIVGSDDVERKLKIMLGSYSPKLLSVEISIADQIQGKYQWSRLRREKDRWGNGGLAYRDGISLAHPERSAPVL